MRVLYFDCFAGISGDMTLGALLDLGLNIEDFKSELKKLDLEGYSITVQKVMKKGIQGTDVNISLLNEGHSHSHCSKIEHAHHRFLKDILELINKSRLNENVKSISTNIMKRLVEAEARVHGITIDQVHFHEVGAVDSIVDIVGTAICIDKLAPDRIICSNLHIGKGFVECQHGIIPLPAPATLELIKGIPFYDNGIEAELVTPTGAAIIAAICHEWGNLPRMTIDQIGYGCGDNDLSIPNLLRVMFGVCEEANTEEADEVIVIETNIDDMNGEITGYLMDILLEVGALDVFYTPIYMKKNRPGVKVSVICDFDKVAIVESIIFKETTTFGIRKYKANRNKLTRHDDVLTTDYGPVKVKVGSRDGEVIKISPEFESCKEVAQKMKVPILEVYRSALKEVKIDVEKGCVD